MSIVLNGRSLLLASAVARQVNCSTASIRELDDRKAVIPVGCTNGCRSATDLCIAQGAYLQFARDMKDQNGNDLDVSSGELVFTIFTGVRGTELLTRGTAGGSITLASTSRALWEITAAQSLALPAGRSYYEFWFEAVSGERYLAAYGNFDVQDTREYDT